MKRLVGFIVSVVVSMQASAAIFYLNQASDTYSISNSKSRYFVIVHHTCNNKLGGDVCVTTPEDGSCHLVCKVNQPCELVFPQQQGKSISLHIAAQNTVGKACGDVEAGV